VRGDFVMSKNLLLGFIDKRPLIIFHYFLLGIVVFLAHWTSRLILLEQTVMQKGGLYWAFLYLWYVLWLLLSDNVIHRVLKVD
jgi:hypothetical protein